MGWLMAGSCFFTLDYLGMKNFLSMDDLSAGRLLKNQWKY
jgi:hypothetical protein